MQFVVSAHPASTAFLGFSHLIRDLSVQPDPIAALRKQAVEGSFSHLIRDLSVQHNRKVRFRSAAQEVVSVTSFEISRCNRFPLWLLPNKTELAAEF